MNKNICHKITTDKDLDKLREIIPPIVGILEKQEQIIANSDLESEQKQIKQRINLAMDIIRWLAVTIVANGVKQRIISTGSVTYVRPSRPN